MRIFGFELYKILKSRGAIIITILLLNIIAFNLSTPKQPFEYDIPKKSVKAIENHIDEMGLEKAYKYISEQNKKYAEADFEKIENIERIYSDNSWEEYTLLKYYNNLLTDLYKYNDYLTEIQDRAVQLSQISIFSKPDTFSYRNIQKSAEQYKKLEGTELTYYKGDVIRNLTGNRITDILAVIILLVIVIQLVVNERDCKVDRLQGTMLKGRFNLALAKLWVLALSVISIFIVLYGTNLIFAIKEGLGDLSVPIQSVNGFYTSPFGITVMEFLIYFFSLKLVILLICGIIFFTVCMLLKDVMAIYITNVLVFVISLIGYIFIEPSSVFSPLKYINLIYYLQTEKLLYEYVNINFFGYPVESILCLGLFIFVTIVGGVALILSLYGKNRLITINMPTIQLKTKGSLSLFLQEAKKLLFSQKALIYIIVLISLNSYWVLSKHYYPTMDEALYKKYINEVSGPYSEEKHKLLIDTREKLKAENIGNNNDIEIKAVEKVIDRADYLKENLKKGKNYSFVYDTGYKRLTDDKIREATNVLVFLIILIVVLSGAISVEKESKVDMLLKTSKYGKGRVLAYKYIVCILLAAVVLLGVYIPEYMSVYKYYGAKEIDAVVGSLPFLKVFKDITIKNYLIGLMAVRYILTLPIVVIIFALSRKTKIQTMLLATAVLCLPVLVFIILI